MKNAFNSLTWKSVYEEIRRRQLPRGLTAVLYDHRKNRKLYYMTEGKIHRCEVYGRVPQGSVLGPLLWNMVYHRLLLLPLSKGVPLIGYADDVALVLVGLGAMKKDLQQSINTITGWYDEEGLEIAQEKMEVVLLTGRKVKGDLKIPIIYGTYDARGVVKYLGVLFQGNQTFKEYVLRTTDKAKSHKTVR